MEIPVTKDLLRKLLPFMPHDRTSCHDDDRRQNGLREDGRSWGCNRCAVLDILEQNDDVILYDVDILLKKRY